VVTNNPISVKVPFIKENNQYVSGCPLTAFVTFFGGFRTDSTIFSDVSFLYSSIISFVVAMAIPSSNIFFVNQINRAHRA